MSLLPAYMSELWRCYEEMRSESLDLINVELISTDPQSCHSAVLPFLAWECDVDISAVSEDTARLMICAAFDAMVYAGTIKALKETVKSLSDDTDVIEWFEYSGEPFHFKTETIVSDYTKRFGSDLFEKMRTSINKNKNVRSVLDEFSIKLDSADGKVEVAGAGTLWAKLANELSLDYNSLGSIDVAGANAINIKLKSDFKQDDKQITLNLTGGGVMDVKISKTIEVVYPQTDINIQGVGIWTI